MVEVLPLLAQRSSGSVVGNPGRAVLNLWLFFNIAPSHLLLPLLCTSLLLARARRNVLLVNVAITWSITGFASSILLYAGKQTGPQPSTILCMTQASLLYAIPPLTSTAVFALVLNVWINLCWKRGERTRTFYLALMVISPYVVYFTFASIAATLGGRGPQRVSRVRRFFYCSLENSGFSAAVAIYAAMMLLITMVLNVWIGLTIWRNNRLLKQAMRMPDQAFPPSGSMEPIDIKKRIKPEDVQFAIRLAIFGVYIVMGLTLSLLSIVAPTSAIPDVVFSSMGLAVFLIFGTQPKLWLVWRDVLRRSPREEESHIPTLTPFQLDPLPGQQQYQQQFVVDEEAPPVSDKPWPIAAQFASPSPMNVTYSSPAITTLASPSLLVTDKRIPAVRFQDVRRSTALTDHPYRTAAPGAETVAVGPLQPRPRLIAAETPSMQERLGAPDARGKQARNPDYLAPPSQSGEAAVSSYESDNRLLSAAASHESRFLQPLTGAFGDAESPGYASMRSQEWTSGYATNGDTAEEAGDRSYGSSSGASLQERMDERKRRTDPVIPRF